MINLQKLSSVLNTKSDSQKINNTRSCKSLPSKVDSTAKEYDLFTNNSTISTGYFYKDSTGYINDPSGKKLFSAPYSIDVDKNGVLYEWEQPIGNLNIFDHEQNTLRVTTQSVLESKFMLFDRYIENTVDRMNDFNLFKANIIATRTKYDMLGTIINLRG